MLVLFCSGVDTRRVPERTIIDTKIQPLYDQLLAEENKHTTRKTGLEEQNMKYDEFIAAL